MYLRLRAGSRAGRVVELGLLAQSIDPGNVLEEEAADDLSGSRRSDLAAPVLAHLADRRFLVGDQLSRGSTVRPMLPCPSAAGSDNAAVVSNVLGDVVEYRTREHGAPNDVTCPMSGQIRSREGVRQ